MEEFLLRSHAPLVGGVFFGALSMMALWESWAPRRPLQNPIRKRWLGNFLFLFINTALSRWLAPVTGISLASVAAEHGWGLFHHIDTPYWLSLCVTVLALDFNRYAQHLVLHKVPFLWRLHRLHHSDQDFDFTTQLRFHPLEALFSGMAIALFIIVLGVSPGGVIVYTLLTVSIGFLQHGNVRYPLVVEPFARALIVTPEMHRIHHSARNLESNRNFGNLLSVWDRLFSTYIAEPSAGHVDMQLGLVDYSDEQSMSLPLMLVDPFLSLRRSVA